MGGGLFFSREDCRVPTFFGMPPVLNTKQILLAMRLAVMFVARAPLLRVHCASGACYFSWALGEELQGRSNFGAGRRNCRMDFELRLGLRHHYEIRAATTSRCEPLGAHLRIAGSRISGRSRALPLGRMI